MRKKLIEVAQPLEAINKASAREKSIRHGHPSTLHLWWARRPLAAARAVIFAQMVDDPSAWPDLFPTERAQQKERERLFRIIEELVQWENTTNEAVLERARAEIWQSWRRACAEKRQEIENRRQDIGEAECARLLAIYDPDKLPAFHDPFAGGGSLPLEAQRLGLESYASDLNPVAVLINKAMIEIPPRFAGKPPVNPESRKQWLEVSHALQGTQSLAEGDGSCEGGLPARTAAAEGGNLRDAVADHPGSGIGSGEYRGGMDEGVGQGEGAVPGSGSGVLGGGGDLPDPVRGTGLVSEGQDTGTPSRDNRGWQDAHGAPSQFPRSSLNPNSYSSTFYKVYKGAQGLAEDVRYYGQWMRDEAEKRIGHLYPKVEVTAEMAADRPDLKPYVGKKLTVIAWLWARTVRSPNPAFADVAVPLASTFMLSTKAGKEAYVEPVIENRNQELGNSSDGSPISYPLSSTSSPGYRFTVKVGKPKDAEAAKNGTKLARGANFRCLMSGTPIAGDYIKAEGQAGRMGARLMAIVAEGERGRVYLAPTPEHEAAARQAKPEWRPETPLAPDPRALWTPPYGLKTWGDLFTPRQLVALTTFSDLVGEAIERVKRDAIAAGLPDDGQPLRDGGTGATAYAEAVGVYLGFLVNQVANHSSSVCGWNNANTQMRSVFARQAIPMVWDFAESNPFCESSGSYANLFERLVRGFETLGLGPTGKGHQADVNRQSFSAGKLVSTDPPYYDNIGYADLSDFFYVWLRRSLRPVFPDLFATLAAPKAEELVATPYRHGGKEAAEKFFLDGMTQAMHRLAEQVHPAFPITIYYAFKQSETETAEGTASTGWETFLEAVIRAGFAITGTWPMRTEKQGRVIGNDTNALASSIVIVCRQRAADAPVVSRREFLRELNATLPEALAEMTRGGVNSPVAPVDLSQAIIGPGMAIFSQYAAVLEADGTPMTVRTALQLINRFLAEDDFDHDTQFCLHWFEQHGWAAGKFGEADVLARAKGTSIDGLKEAGVLTAAKGEVRLLKWAELPADWSPEQDARTPVWEALHQMIRALNQDGESAAGALLARMPARAEPIRALAYRLYTLCERQGWAIDARAYNELVTAWSAIEQAAGEVGVVGTQGFLDI